MLNFSATCLIVKNLVSSLIVNVVSYGNISLLIRLVKSFLINFNNSIDFYVSL